MPIMKRFAGDWRRSFGRGYAPGEGEAPAEPRFRRRCFRLGRSLALPALSGMSTEDYCAPDNAIIAAGRCITIRGPAPGGRGSCRAALGTASPALLLGLAGAWPFPISPPLHPEDHSTAPSSLGIFPAAFPVAPPIVARARGGGAFPSSAAGKRLLRRRLLPHSFFALPRLTLRAASILVRLAIVVVAPFRA